MEQRQTLHIVNDSSRGRAEMSRLGFELGHHCEVYADVGELLSHPPDSGIVLIDDDVPGQPLIQAVSALEQIGLWLPIIGTSSEPRPFKVVAAIKAGALDYLRRPLNPVRLADAVERIAVESAAHAEARRKTIEARTRLSSLSAREREVLDWLTEGQSNKMIARQLHISPRTVEIHRANMMTKLGAQHPAQAVRLRIEAGLGARMATATH